MIVLFGYPLTMVIWVVTGFVFRKQMNGNIIAGDFLSDEFSADDGTRSLYMPRSARFIKTWQWIIISLIAVSGLFVFSYVCFEFRPRKILKKKPEKEKE